MIHGWQWLIATTAWMYTLHPPSPLRAAFSFYHLVPVVLEQDSSVGVLSA